MYENFVPYDLALALTDRGFNGDCPVVYCVNDNTRPYPADAIVEGDVIEAPTYAQAFRWLLKTHSIHINFSPRSMDYMDGVHIVMWSIWADITDIWMTSIPIEPRSCDDPYLTIEEAEYAALKGGLELLDKLPGIKEKLKIYNDTKGVSVNTR